MGKLYEKLNNRPAILLIVIVLLLPFAYFVNLGLMPLISDEPTRGIVTLEMLYSGNFITPTINGEFYYNKPPLFNWILAGFVQLSGLSNEFIFRLPTVISLLLTGIIIFLSARKELGKINAMLVAIMFITSARIVFWDSFQGLIDITYSLITFSSFT
ncbi:MAG: 4-amino-4-deoxy-L-arabinose transferase, partial [Bacteroidetes bacterium HGW-Bacteroidetes-9]